MNVRDTIRGIQLLYIETAPFIYYTERRDGYVEKMRSVFTDVHTGRVHIITSVVTLVETLMKPLKENDTTLVRRYREMFYRTQHMTLVPISAGVAESAADLRARYNLRTPDALHIATAIDAGCDAFLTNDIDIKRVQEIAVLVLDELELERDPPAAP
jgi:predicted nucleic acid-binding protein